MKHRSDRSVEASGESNPAWAVVIIAILVGVVCLVAQLKRQQQDNKPQVTVTNVGK
jgi:hypothetical protein